MKKPSAQKERAIKAYKQIISDAIRTCPTGTKLRIAKETGTSKSFVSQMLNPEQSVPIPLKHIDVFLAAVALSARKEAAFRAAHAAAHPPTKRTAVSDDQNVMWIKLPDFENAEQRKRVEDAIRASADSIINLMIGQSGIR